MAKNYTGMVYMENVIDGIALSETAGNSTEMEHLKSSIDDVFVISNGIIVCCE
jgi:hypothetical protein